MKIFSLTENMFFIIKSAYIKLYSFSYFRLTIILLLSSILTFKLINELNETYLLGVHPSVELQNIPLSSYIRTIIIIPFLEELMYRLGVFFKPIYASFFATSIFDSICAHTFLEREFIDSLNIKGMMYILSSYLFMLIFSWYIFNKYEKFFTNFWEINRKYIIVVSVIVFSYAHFDNYQINDPYLAIILSPILLLPQISCGIILCIVRIKHGFFYSYFSHTLVNSVLAVLTHFSLI